MTCSMSGPRVNARLWEGHITWTLWESAHTWGNGKDGHQGPVLWHLHFFLCLLRTTHPASFTSCMRVQSCWENQRESRGTIVWPKGTMSIVPLFWKGLRNRSIKMQPKVGLLMTSFLFTFSCPFISLLICYLFSNCSKSLIPWVYNVSSDACKRDQFTLYFPEPTFSAAKVGGKGT